MTTSNVSGSRMSADAMAMSRGTDVEVENACTPCLQDDEKRIESVVFCLECSEHLCGTCRHHHRKLKLTRAHHLIEIGKGNHAEADDTNTTESCQEHPGKCIEYLCENHDSFCCRTCREISHSGCDSIRCIMDEASSLVESGEALNAEESLKSLTTKVASQIQTKRKQTVNISDQAAVALIQIKTERSSAIERINKLADEAENDIKTKSSDVKDKIQNEIETMESVLDTLNVTEKCLTTVRQNASVPQIYIAVKRAEHQLKKYAVYSEEVDTHLTEANVQFKLDSTFHSLQEKLVTMGTVIVGRSETSEQDQQNQSMSYLQVNNSRRHIRRHSSSSSAGSKRKKAIPVGGHSVRIPGDKTTCHITGSEILQDGRIVLADHNNKSIKIFNKNCSYINHIALRSRPKDIVVIGEDEIATSLIDENAIQSFSVSGSLCFSKRIETGYPYYGLAFSDRRQLYGTTSMDDGTGEIHVIDMTGNILGSIKKINDQVDLIRPTAICINNKSQLLYVTDLGRNSVFCLDISTGFMNYRHVFTYTDRNLEVRSGITVDSEGYVYISSGNMTVHQISFGGNKIHEILTSADGLGMPHCLAFSARDDHLLVSEFKENSFKLFALR